jgi:hypothetical protein
MNTELTILTYPKYRAERASLYDYQCLLEGTNGQRSMCMYTYALASISFIVLVIISVLQVGYMMQLAAQ